ncbi:hypothetical protein ACFQU2_22180 [Siccirubricoccus deserti]
MRALPLLLLIGVAACAQQQTVEFLPSRKGAEELRAMQTRVVAGEPDEVARAVIGTLHDLGYRITRADAETGTISATRATALRIAVVVRPRPPGQVAVRANATIVALRQEAQVDAADSIRRISLTSSAPSCSGTSSPSRPARRPRKRCARSPSG